MEVSYRQFSIMWFEGLPVRISDVLCGHIYSVARELLGGRERETPGPIPELLLGAIMRPTLMKGEGKKGHKICRRKRGEGKMKRTVGENGSGGGDGGREKINDFHDGTVLAK